MNLIRHATIRLFKPTGARKRMPPIITPCSMYGNIRILALSGAIAFISTVSIFLMSVWKTQARMTPAAKVDLTPENNLILPP